ncbi:outer membrane protein [Bartonella sp. A05]|uniref:outer membrane protein n=1 Tax=Bartonella sp. A05 TaxID=2967261 RepID=UPI0022A91CDB|nr:outer membrane protein [Bartonella sp. A05]MCZ2203356.1 porin family protein [Bartonella sp. A05]
MNMRYLVAASVAAVVSVSVAQAQSFTISTGKAAAFSWAGLYIGVQGGHSSFSKPADSEASSVPDKKLGDETKKSDLLSNVVGGIYAGYNFDLGGNLILGVDTDAVLSGSAFTKGKNGTDRKMQENWSGATRARVGFSFGRMMPYAAGGIVYAQLKAAAEDNDLADAGDKIKMGYTLGGGLEFAAIDNVIVRGEYRHSGFGDFKLTTSMSELYKASYTTNDFRVGVAFKF